MFGKRLLFGVLAVLVVVCPVAQACRIPIIIYPPFPHPPHPHPHPRPVPKLSPIETRAHKVEIVIDGAVARVEVSATFYNPNPGIVEGTYFFPIEPDAVVKRFAMTVNGKEMKAELLPADKARKIYEEIVRKMKDPGLLEYVGTRMLKCRVFPIQPRSEIQVRLTYHQAVRADGGLYHLRYPLSSAKPNVGTVDQVAVQVRLASETPVKLFYSPSHKIDTVRKDDRHVHGGFEQAKVVPDRDFEIYWSLDKADVGISVAAYRPKGEDGFCLLALSPKVADDRERVEPKDIVFVFDKSGSMSGDKIKQARGALTYCLDRLAPQDRFGVIAFSTAADVLTDGLQPASAEAVAGAKETVGRMEAAGGTAIHEAMQEACKLVKDSKRLAIIVFLTDGKPTVGPADIETILKDTRKANTARARVFAFGVGDNLNTDLLDRIAVDNRGAQSYVGEREDIEVKVSAFYEKIARPVLSDVTIEVDGVKLTEVYPSTIPDIFRGGQVLVFARYRGAGKHDVTVRGKAGGRQRVFEYAADFDGKDANAFLPPIWAHRKIAYLLEQIRLHGSKKELTDEVAALGKRYGIMTPYNSFLIVEDGAMPVAVRRELEGHRHSFEAAKSGADAVDMSQSLARGKGAARAPSASAPVQLGWGGGGGAGGAAQSQRAETVNRAIRKSVKRIADKVFYRKADGYFYDSTFEEKDRGDIVDVKYFSDKYFGLLDRHPGIGKYLAAKAKIVLCVDGKVYRVGE